MLVISSITWAVRINIWLVIIQAIVVSYSLVQTLDHGPVIIQLWVIVWLLLLVATILPLLLTIVLWWHVSLAIAGMGVVSTEGGLIYVLLTLVDALEVIVIVDR